MQLMDAIDEAVRETLGYIWKAPFIWPFFVFIIVVMAAMVLGYQMLVNRIARRCHVPNDRIDSLTGRTTDIGGNVHWKTFSIWTLHRRCHTEKDVERFERLRDELEALDFCPECACN